VTNRRDGNQRYVIEGTIHVRGKVRRIIGAFGWFDGIVISGKDSGPAFQIDDTAHGTVVIEDLQISNGYRGRPRRPVFLHKGITTLVLRSINSLMVTHSFYRGSEGCGPVFFEDVASQWPATLKNVDEEPNLYFAPGQKVWARQLDVEKAALKVLNDGADFWVFGLKTEQNTTMVETRPGGQTEILGILTYPSLGPGSQPMFVNENCAFSASIAEAGFTRRYNTLVRETRGEEMRVLKRGEAPGHLGGSMLPLYVGHVPADSSPPMAVPRVSGTALSHSEVRVEWRPVEDPQSGIGYYLVRRDGRRIATTRETSVTDRGLRDATEYRYEVVAVNGALQESAAAACMVRTDPDETAPRATKATSPMNSGVLTMTFDEPVDRKSAQDAGNYKLAGEARVVSAELQDAKTVVLRIRGLDYSDRTEVRVTGVKDLAQTPNPIPPPGDVLKVAYTAEQRVLLEQRFEDTADGDVPSGVRDDSAWRKAKADLEVVKLAEPNNTRALRCGVQGYAQVILGRAELEKGKRYLVEMKLNSEKPDHNVRIWVRKLEGPYTMYAHDAARVGPGRLQPISLEFVAGKSDRQAVIFLIAQGTTTLHIDDVVISEIQGESDD
jgi:hypothetical protein